MFFFVRFQGCISILYYSTFLRVANYMIILCSGWACGNQWSPSVGWKESNPLCVHVSWLKIGWYLCHSWQILSPSKVIPFHRPYANRPRWYLYWVHYITSHRARKHQQLIKSILVNPAPDEYQSWLVCFYPLPEIHPVMAQSFRCPKKRGTASGPPDPSGLIVGKALMSWKKPSSHRHLKTERRIIHILCLTLGSDMNSEPRIACKGSLRDWFTVGNG